MHHAVKMCNYGPCTTLVDRVFDTYRPFAVRTRPVAGALNQAGPQLNHATSFGNGTCSL